MDGYERIHYTQKNSAFQISVFPKIFVHTLSFFSFSLSLIILSEDCPPVEESKK